MKAQAFLNLVSEMMTAQQDYFKARNKDKVGSRDLLVKAKQLEAKVMAVIDEKHLEPDDPPLDFPEEVRPTEPQQASLFDKESDRETEE